MNAIIVRAPNLGEFAVKRGRYVVGTALTTHWICKTLCKEKREGNKIRKQNIIITTLNR